MSNKFEKMCECINSIKAKMLMRCGAKKADAKEEKEEAESKAKAKKKPASKK